MFLIGFLVGAIIGGSISLVLYACILVGKDKENG